MWQYDEYPLDDPVDDDVGPTDVDLGVRPNGCSLNYSIAYMDAIWDDDDMLDARLAKCITAQNELWRKEGAMYLPLPQNGNARVALWTTLSLLNDALQAPSAYHADAMVATRFHVGDYHMSPKMFDRLYHVSRFMDDFFKNGAYIHSKKRSLS